MFTRLVETALVNIGNAVVRKARIRASGRPLPPGPDGQCLVGHTLPARPHERPEPVCLDPAIRRKHLYVLGATGSGKTNFLMRLLEDDIAAGRSFCVADLRGDLVDRVLLRLAATVPAAELKERLVLIDLRNESRVVPLNPLSGAGDIHARAFHVLAVIEHQAEGLGVQISETLRNCLIALAETGWSLLEIEPLLCSRSFRADVVARVTDPYVKSFFARYEKLSDDRKTQWTLPVLNKVTPLYAIPQLRRMFGQRQGLDMRELLDGMPGRIVLVSLAVDRLHAGAHLAGGLFVSAVQNAAMARVDMPEDERVPVNFVIDEFENLCSDKFQEIIAEGRRFGLGLTLSHQNLSQLPPTLRDMLRNNVSTQVLFSTGSVDAAELVGDIVSDESARSVKQALISQGVGEAFVVRRGQQSVRMKAVHSPDPKVPKAKVDALRNAAMARWAVPTQEIDRELRERNEAFSQPDEDEDDPPPARPARRRAAPPKATKDPGTGAQQPSPLQSQTADTSPVHTEVEEALDQHCAEAPQERKPTYEIRHAKQPGRFAPKKREDD